MDKEKSLLETLTDTVKAAAESIAHPTEGTPMQMPLNESGYAITHLQPTPKPAAEPSANNKKKAAQRPAKRAASRKSKSAAGKKAKKPAAKSKKKTVKQVARKKKAKKSRR
jgi:hypothetical protein